MNDKVLSALGLAKKAGKLTVGTNLVSTFIRNDSAPSLVILACDASNNTKKLIESASRHHKVRCVRSAYTMDELSTAIGASYYISCIAVLDRGFGEMIYNHLKESDNHLSLQEV